MADSVKIDREYKELCQEYLTIFKRLLDLQSSILALDKKVPMLEVDYKSNYHQRAVELLMMSIHKELYHGKNKQSREESREAV